MITCICYYCEEEFESESQERGAACFCEECEEFWLDDCESEEE